MSTRYPHSTKRREADIEAAAFNLHKKGMGIEVAAELMRLANVEILLDCGCRFAEEYTACKDHRSNNAPQVCFCGRCDELTAATAAAYRPYSRYSAEKAERLRRQRIEHFAECCKTPWVNVRGEPAGSAGTHSGEERPDVSNGSSPSSSLSKEEMLRRIFDSV